MVFLIISIIVFYSICLLVTRRLTWIEILATTWFGLYFEAMTNVYLDLKYDLYGYFNKGVDWHALIPLLGIYPPLNYLILNFYPEGRGFLLITAYLLTWDLFSVIYELLSINAGVFYHNGWQWWYSAIVYPPIFLILWYHLKFVRWLKRMKEA